MQCELKEEGMIGVVHPISEFDHPQVHARRRCFPRMHLLWSTTSKQLVSHHGYDGEALQTMTLLQQPPEIPLAVLTQGCAAIAAWIVSHPLPSYLTISKDSVQFWARLAVLSLELASRL